MNYSSIFKVLWINKDVSQSYFYYEEHHIQSHKINKKHELTKHYHEQNRENIVTTIMQYFLA